MASPERPRAAFIGLGIMGRSMAASLARAGFQAAADGLGERDLTAVMETVTP